MRSGFGPNEETWFYANERWPGGPWKSEPSAVRFDDPSTGLPCRIVRQDHDISQPGWLQCAIGLPDNHWGYRRGAHNFPEWPLNLYPSLTVHDMFLFGKLKSDFSLPARMWWLYFCYVPVNENTTYEDIRRVWMKLKNVGAWLAALPPPAATQSQGNGVSL